MKNGRKDLLGLALRLLSILVAAVIYGSCFLLGCSLRQQERNNQFIGAEVASYDLIQEYITEVQQNIKKIEYKYTKEYIKCDFIVDLENSSTHVQDLIDTLSVKPILKSLNLEGVPVEQKASSIYRYVISNFSFVQDPYTWPTVKETIENKSGDCNSLSLLLMSLFYSSGIETYSAVSNGHMWVYALVNGNWLLFELDQDPLRKRIYRIPGFYKYPIYKIYINYTMRRKPIEWPVRAGKGDNLLNFNNTVQ